MLARGMVCATTVPRHLCTPVWTHLSLERLHSAGTRLGNLPGGCPSAQDEDSPVSSGRYPSTYSEDALVPWPSVGVLQSSVWG